MYNNLMNDFYDLNGKNIEIKSCSNRYSKNMLGKFVSESKNMIYLYTEKNSNQQIKKISKKEIGLIKVVSEDGVYFIRGQCLKGRPEEKISKFK